MFAGCGTTLIEAKRHGRISIGFDVNPVAKLITNAKIHPIKPSNLKAEYELLLEKISSYDESLNINIPEQEKIDYWFEQKEKRKIAFLLSKISEINNKRIREFFLCSLSNILKNSSMWLQSSTKPQKDKSKKPADPIKSFKYHSGHMIERNEKFYEELKKNGYLRTSCNIFMRDAQKTKLVSNSVDLIISSPPYVTSYEYADIHQLTGYWYNYISDMNKFRKKFIGTFYSNNQDLECNSKIAEKIVNTLSEKHKKFAKEIANYFNTMENVFIESKRILKDNGRVCFVIGNTTIRNVKIKNAEVFYEILTEHGFEIEDVILR